MVVSRNVEAEAGSS